MAIQQTKKQSDLEKRLRLLRQQVYGKGSEHKEPDFVGTENSVSQKNQYIRVSDNLIHRNTDIPFSRSEVTVSSDSTYLYQDLLKISILASLALGVQIILFFLLQHSLLRINFL